MTYITALHHNANVYVVADSAVTEYGASDTPPTPAVSSFGEAVHSDGGRTVRQGRLKISHFGPLAYAFSGAQDTGRDVGLQLLRRLSNGMSSRSAIVSVFEDWLKQTVDFEAVMTFLENGEPKLVSFTTDSPGGTPVLRDHVNGGIQIGSPPPMFQKLTWFSMSSLVEQPWFDRVTSHARLAVVLSYVQSYVVRRYLAPYGVGGVFTGLVCHPDGLDWQPDMLFMLLDGGGHVSGWASSCVRGNALITASSYTSHLGVFGTPASIRPESMTDEWIASELADPLAGRFDFVSLVNLQCWQLAVVEMRRSLRHLELHLDPPNSVLGLHGELRRALLECRDEVSNGMRLRTIFAPFVCASTT